MPSVLFKVQLSPFSSDDSASAASSMEVTDRIASLEQRVQMQEDEIQLLKSALADVVRRLNVSEEQQAMGSRRGPTKGRIHTKSCCLMLFLALFWGIKLQKKCVFSLLFLLVFSLSWFPSPDELSLSSSSPRLSSFLPACVANSTVRPR